MRYPMRYVVPKALSSEQADVRHVEVHGLTKFE